MADVDFLVNCYERTYRDVLAPGFMAARVAEQQREFAAVTVLVNNVDDRPAAERLAAAAVESGEVTRVVFVEDHLEEALRVTRLRRSSMQRLPHFTDWALAALVLGGPDWLLHWDAEAVLDEPCDWVSPSVAYLAAHPGIVVANPESWFRLARREAQHVDGDFAVGYGFSDQVYLMRRSQFARPIYRKIAPASWRGPLSHVEPIFEQRVDAWMRRTGHLRATYLPAAVSMPTADFGASYPAADLRSKVRGRVQRAVRGVGERVSAHPAIRAWPGQVDG